MQDDFWAYNNGITILTTKVEPKKDKLQLQGISIINGAQTTGSISSVDSKIDVSRLRVLTRIIQCTDPSVVDEIVKFNNTQNKITTWDKYSGDSEQKRIYEEFLSFGQNYSLKRGFNKSVSYQLGIEDVIQPLIAFQGMYNEANYGKNKAFESDKIYRSAFEGKKARHILFCYIVSKTIDDIRNDFRNKSSQLIGIEEKQLKMLKSLKFKYFFMSVIGDSMETVLNKKIEKSDVGFTTDFCKKTIIELIIEIKTTVQTILAFVAQSIDGDFSELLDEDTFYNDVINKVNVLLYTTLNLNTLMFDNIRKAIV